MKRSAKSIAREALAVAEGMLTNRANFGTMDNESLDSEVKKAIRLYVESWLVPPLQELVEKLEKSK